MLHLPLLQLHFSINEWSTDIRQYLYNTYTIFCIIVCCIIQPIPIINYSEKIFLFRKYKYKHFISNPSHFHRIQLSGSFFIWINRTNYQELLFIYIRKLYRIEFFSFRKSSKCTVLDRIICEAKVKNWISKIWHIFIANLLLRSHLKQEFPFLIDLYIENYSVQLFDQAHNDISFHYIIH